MEELKRCPFCGGEAAQEAGKDLYGEFECVYCKECSACIKADTKEEAIAGWNNRKPVNVVLERLEELKMAEIDDSDNEPECNDAEEWFDEGESSGRFEAYGKAIEIIKELLGGSTDV